MMKRTKLADRSLPVYSIGEEIVNTATHLIGGMLGVIALVLCVRRASELGGAPEITGAAVNGSWLCCCTPPPASTTVCARVWRKR